MTQTLPFGTVTFLFTDIEGSTPFWERAPDQMAQALQIHNLALRQAIEDQGGVVFKVVGDSFQAAFPSAPQALRAAIAGQRALQAAPWNALGPLKVRMGLHSGEASLDPGGDEYAVSHTKNRVGRIHAVASGGQILLSQETAHLARRDLPDGAWLKDLGEHYLKGMTLPEHLFQVCAPGLIENFPPLPTLTQAVHNLPLQMTSFIGREKEIALAREWVISSRLVTLTGAGGVGKTRLSIVIARGLLSEFHRGIWQVELAAVNDPALIPQAIAGLFGLRPDAGRSYQDILLEYLRAKRLLLLLDNCEHLLEGCAAIAALILQHCPEVHLLATSREALGLAGEVVFQVPPLSTPNPSDPGDAESLQAFEAVRLFCERARAVLPNFAPTQENAGALASICQRLDGIPLALELAAARLKILSLAQIASRLNDRFRLLTGGSRLSLPHHQTLSALIDWSYELLSIPEQALFRCLSVFSGGCTLEAAQAVGGEQILDLLSRLIDKSLLQPIPSEGGEYRFRMLETIRLYAFARLVEAGEAEPARERHLDHYLQVAESSFEGLYSGENWAWMERLRAEMENIRSALEWSLSGEAGERAWKGLRAASVLGTFWYRDGSIAEGRKWLERGLVLVEKGHPQDPTHRARANIAFCAIAVFDSFFRTRAREMGIEGLLIYQQVGDVFMTAYAETILGDLYLGVDAPLALSYLNNAIEKYRQLGKTGFLAEALCLRGYLYLFDLPDDKLARQDIEAGIALYRSLGDRWQSSFWQGYLGNIELRRGDFVQARRYFEERLVRMTQARDRFGIAWAWQDLGQVARLQQDFPQMELMFQNAYQVMEEIGAKLDMLRYLRLIAVAVLQQGDIQRAIRLLVDFISKARATGDPVGLATCLVQWAGVALAKGKPELAAQYLAAVDAGKRRVGFELYGNDQRDLVPYLEACRQQLSPEAFATAWQTGTEQDPERLLDDIVVQFGG